jgi:hypothetical protein
MTSPVFEFCEYTSPIFGPLAETTACVFKDIVASGVGDGRARAAGNIQSPLTGVVLVPAADLALSLVICLPFEMVLVFMLLLATLECCSSRVAWCGPSSHSDVLME